jgi:putative ABC transport system substrate-binding protein
MRRRAFITLLGGAAAWPLGARAQRSERIARIGILIAASVSGYATRIEGLRAGLRALGYVEGRNLVIELRAAEGNYGRLRALAEELLRLKVDILVTHGVAGSLAAKEATTSIPIVMAVIGDPVAMGVVPALVRPGGNITGSSFFVLELVTKRLEFLKTMAPRIRRPALLVNPDNAFTETMLQAATSAASALSLALRPFPVRRIEEMEENFSPLARDGVDALVVMDDAVFLANHSAIVEFAARHRLPSGVPSEFAPAGGLIGYGVDYVAMFHRAASFIDKILKGAEPGSLPIEQATKFELVLNLATAKALELEVPPLLLARADEVIE